jgi:hypothetical protein
MTRVIHIGDAPVGWQNNPEYVYCGRPGKGLASKWGNDNIPKGEEDRNIVCDMFYDDFHNNPELMAAALIELKDKILVCFCKPKRCHCDTIANFVNNHYKEKEKNNGFFNE